MTNNYDSSKKFHPSIGVTEVKITRIDENTLKIIGKLPQPETSLKKAVHAYSKQLFDLPRHDKAENVS